MTNTIKCTNLYYFQYINIIGGIETFFYHLSRQYKCIDIVIVYRQGDDKQIKRLSKYVKCIKYTDQKFECEKAFFNYNTDIIDQIQADEYILVLHGDYQTMVNQKQLDIKNLPMHPRITKYIGVSEIVCESWYQLTGITAELCYNPFILDKPNIPLKLISATRLSREKGKNRMIKLMKALNKANVNYQWDIYTNDKDAIIDKHITYKQPKLDILSEIAQADYLVQLSDNEGFCYSIIEALSLGTPVICTPCPVFEELGLKNQKNCYIIDFDMKNIPINNIVNKKLQFTYTPPKDNWNKLLSLKPSTYTKDKYIVQATDEWQSHHLQDITLGHIPKKNETWVIDYDRLQALLNNTFNLKLIDVIGYTK